MSCGELYDKLPWYQKVAVNVARCAPLPHHVALILDGTRRYAAKRKIKKQEGFALAFQRFDQVVEWSLLLGLKEVTMFTMSIENFKREKCELDVILMMVEQKFESFVNNLDFYVKHGIRLNVIGEKYLLSDKLQALVSKLMKATRDCNAIQINIALAYTSRAEICSTMKAIVHGVGNDEIDPDNIDEEFFTRCLHTRNSPQVDLLIRTSGVTRLSDFLLWQSSSSKLLFMKAFWPEITLWKIVFHLISYQRSILHDQTLQLMKKINANNGNTIYDEFSQEKQFLDKLTALAEGTTKPF